MQRSLRIGGRAAADRVELTGQRRDPIAGLMEQLARAARAQAAQRPAPAPAPVGPAEPAQGTTRVVSEPDDHQKMILHLLKRMFGIDIGSIDKVEVAAGHAVAESQTAAASVSTGTQGVAIDYAESYRRCEVAAFSAAGEVTTTDGRRFAFSIDYRMASTLTLDRRVSVGSPPRDPLVLDLGGDGVRLAGRPGQAPVGGSAALPRFAPGNLMLAIAPPGDGALTGVGDLVGGRSGNAYADLGRLDADRNGWIDEADPAFNALRLWDGTSRPSLLLDLGVGAIATGSKPFLFSHLDPASARQLAQTTRAGVFLYDDGRPGVAQQVDLTA
jgi:hypothetical protein